MVRELIIETGAVRGRNRRALDSTVLDDAVARQDSVTQLIAAARRVGRDVPDAAALIVSVCSYADSQTGKPTIAWDDPVARDALVSQLVTDALALIAALDVEALSAVGGKAAEAVAILALVAGQDVQPAEGSDGTDGRWPIAQKVTPDRMISTVDPESRHTRKSRENRQEGFKAHLVVEPDTGLTTAAALTKTNGPDNSDATIGGQLLDADPTIAGAAAEGVDPGEDDPAGDDPSRDQQVAERTEVLGDSAYGSAICWSLRLRDLLDKIDKAGWAATIKPTPCGPRSRALSHPWVLTQPTPLRRPWRRSARPKVNHCPNTPLVQQTPREAAPGARWSGSMSATRIRPGKPWLRCWTAFPSRCCTAPRRCRTLRCRARSTSSTRRAAVVLAGRLRQHHPGRGRRHPPTVRIGASHRAVDHAPVSDRRRGARRRLRRHRLGLPGRHVGLGVRRGGSEPSDADAIRRWSIDYFEALHPYSAGGAYVNMMMDEGDDRVRASYRDNYPRLAQVTAGYDPDNVFRVNQNIKPAARTD